MSTDIVKARNQGANVGPVKAPLYQITNDTRYEGITSMPVLNKIESEPKAFGGSILDCIVKTTSEFEDLSGRTVTMVAKIGENVTRDTVKVIGCTNSAYVVEINGVEYSVRRAIVRFCEIVGE